MTTFENSPFVVAPVQQRSREALAKITDAAVRLIASDAASNFSMAEVAQLARVPVASLYRRFKSKDDLLRAIKLDATNRIEQSILETVVKTQADTLDEFVFAVAHAVAQAFGADERLHAFLFSSAVRNQDLDNIGLGAKNRIYALYREMLLPFLGKKGARADFAARVSFYSMYSAFIGKARGSEPLLLEMTWDELAAAFAEVALAYLIAFKGKRGR